MSILDQSARPVKEARTAVDAELRLHRRFALPLSGRFMLADKTEQRCELRDISVGGVAVSHDPSLARPHAGDHVIAYIDQLGGLQGQVIRVWPGGFAFGLSATLHKREKLAAQITWLLNAQDLDGAARRRHQRMTVCNRAGELVIAGGVSIPCLILDVSVSGASVACKVKPDIDTEVWLSGLGAHVVRHHQEGVGMQFKEILEPETVQAYFS